mmetsp:Transcript_82621/g.137844  ORF Transcript_82621/g.137844 Transcript_82621/m.137844 type:complete len:205 (+) Transcript_82621:1339-1953(+)
MQLVLLCFLVSLVPLFFITLCGLFSFQSLLLLQRDLEFGLQIGALTKMIFCCPFLLLLPTFGIATLIRDCLRTNSTRLIVCGHFVGSVSNDTIRIITISEQQGEQQQTHVKAIAGLPCKSCRRRYNHGRQLLRILKFFICNVMCNERCTRVVVIQLPMRQLRRSDKGADEFLHPAFIVRRKHQLRSSRKQLHILAPKVLNVLKT